MFSIPRLKEFDYIITVSPLTSKGVQIVGLNSVEQRTRNPLSPVDSSSTNYSILTCMLQNASDAAFSHSDDLKTTFPATLPSFSEKSLRFFNTNVDADAARSIDVF